MPPHHQTGGRGDPSPCRDAEVAEGDGLLFARVAVPEEPVGPAVGYTSAYRDAEGQAPGDAGFIPPNRGRASGRVPLQAGCYTQGRPLASMAQDQWLLGTHAFQSLFLLGRPTFF